MMKVVVYKSAALALESFKTYKRSEKSKKQLYEKTGTLKYYYKITASNGEVHYYFGKKPHHYYANENVEIEKLERDIAQPSEYKYYLYVTYRAEIIAESHPSKLKKKNIYRYKKPKFKLKYTDEEVFKQMKQKSALELYEYHLKSLYTEDTMYYLIDLEWQH